MEDLLLVFPIVEIAKETKSQCKNYGHLKMTLINGSISSILMGKMNFPMIFGNESHFIKLYIGFLSHSFSIV